MEYWLVREKLEQVVVVELREKATRHPKTADQPPSPRLLVGKQPEQVTLRRVLFPLPA